MISDIIVSRVEKERKFGHSERCDTHFDGYLSINQIDINGMTQIWSSECVGVYQSPLNLLAMSNRH